MLSSNINQHKHFPNTPAYLIVFEGGAGGNFINTILFNLLHGERPKKVFESGHAHNENGCGNSTVESFTLWREGGFYSKVPGYEFLIPNDLSEPILIMDHCFPEYHRFFKIYPLGKIIYITTDETDGPIIKGNLFYKVTQDLYSTPEVTLSSARIRKDYNQQVLNTELHGSNPNNLTINDIVKLIDPNNYTPQFSNVNVPKHYEDKIYKIAYKDILHNQNKVLSLLSKITNKPIRQDIIDFYNEYVNKQKELVKSKMPWVKEVLQN